MGKQIRTLLSCSCYFMQSYTLVISTGTGTLDSYTTQKYHRQEEETDVTFTLNYLWRKLVLRCAISGQLLSSQAHDWFRSQVTGGSTSLSRGVGIVYPLFVAGKV